MTITIVMHPLIRARKTSIVVGDQGFYAKVSQFFPLEEPDAVSGAQGASNGPDRSSLQTSPGKLVITNRIQTFENEASWSTSVKEQLAILAQKTQILVGDATSDKTGTGDSVATGTGGYAKLTDAGATFATTDVYRTLIISGATDPNNNGAFLITGFIDANNILYDNSAYTAETSAFSWTVTGDVPLTPTQIRAL